MLTATLVLQTVLAVESPAVAEASAPLAQDEPPWSEILQPVRAWPDAEDDAEEDAEEGPVFWHGDLHQALDLATRTNRPLFVSLRCLPCKQCASFDADLLDGGPRLTPLLRRFVTVRLTDAAQLDLRLLPAAGYQDLDLSSWCYILSPEGSLYSVFGGKDHVSDETRISIEALATNLERVLDHHHDARRGDWGIDRPAPALGGPPRGPRELPRFDEWLAADPWAQSQSCIHCHQVADILRWPEVEAGTFDKEHELDVWPLPENIGLELDRDHGLRVTSVAPGSPAAAIGVEAGDVLGAAGGVRVFGQADLRGVLHRAGSEPTQLELVWLRGESVLRGELSLAGSWRKTVLDWRMSISQGVVGAAPGFFPNRGPRTGRGSLSVRPFFGPRPRGPAHAAGLHGGHEIVAVGGERPDLSGRAFLVWFRRRYEPGDEVVLTVRERSGEREIRYRPARH